LENKACRIYVSRPLICSLFPFTARKCNNTTIFEVSEDCPGVGMGNRILEEDYRKMFEAAKPILS
jgi:Fe-S-cluster containining protein